ncbi:hypothetical protein MBAV_001283 [Candidatus Magnetobacterium bavaricum]|uniref:Uncharacterized protein n=1 Tax=Candidatus Magnetobacterium bavaricum TaxID=29290 RepID=A0A0F3GXD4_9BACT|nr:hypothetical protein MBAV_001283 [Candidatus Magnetobacterium bavaricum]
MALALRLLAEPLTLRERDLDNRLRRDRLERSALCPLMVLPSLIVVRFDTPRSTPVAAWFSRTGTICSTSTVRLTNHLSAVRETIADLILPLNLNDSLILTQPIMGSFICWSITSTAVGCFLSVPPSARKLSCCPFFLNRGYLPLPEKNRLKAVPRFLIACCGAFLVTSNIHGNWSALISFNCLRKAISDGLGSVISAL